MDSHKMYGLVDGCLIGQQDRVDELNERISSRHFPDHALQPNFDPRPTNTRYTMFPMVDQFRPINEPIQIIEQHNVSTNFSPATRKGPVSTYLANVNTETILRNQQFALQHGADQAVYVPSSTSDLYRVEVVGRQEVQPFERLFDRPSYKTTQPAIIQSLGKDRFNNSTRVQLRNSDGY
jgi:hypothetical protein